VEYTMRTSPITLPFWGKRWNDKLDDFSQQAIDDDLRENQKPAVLKPSIPPAFPSRKC
jgi:hypothetical protein